MPARKLPRGVYLSGSSYRWIITKPFRASKSGYATPEAAERDRNIRLGELAQGIADRPTQDSVAGWVAKWLQAHARKLTPASQGDYADWLRLYIEPHIGSIKLRDLTVNRVQRWHGQLLAGEPRTARLRAAEGTQVITRALAPKTVQEAHTLLVGALDAALADGMIAKNVARLAGGVLVEETPPVIWSEADLRRFEREARGERLYALWHVAAWSGLRIGELLALRWQDVDLTTGMLRVWRNRSETADRQPVIVERTKTRTIRYVELPPECVAVLKEHRAAQNTRRLASGRFWIDEGLVFANDRGGMRNYNGVRQALARLCKRLGLPVVSPHKLRHTHGSLLGAAGASQREIADRLGHSSLQTTERYVHGVAGRQREALDRVRARLDRASGE
jgi:integrase